MARRSSTWDWRSPLRPSRVVHCRSRAPGWGTCGKRCAVPTTRSASIPPRAGPGRSGSARARAIVEPTSKEDSVRVLDEIGVNAISYRTIKRRLPTYANDEWRQALSGAAAQRARSVRHRWCSMTSRPRTLAKRAYRAESDEL